MHILALTTQPHARVTAQNRVELTAEDIAQMDAGRVAAIRRLWTPWSWQIERSEHFRPAIMISGAGFA
jgi:hypothetical protein